MDNKDLIFGIYINEDSEEGPSFVFQGRSKEDCLTSTVAALVMLMCMDECFRNNMVCGLKAYLEEGDELTKALKGKGREFIVDNTRTKS